jgi:hypothetical protein
MGQPLEQLGVGPAAALGAARLEQLAERLAELEQFLAKLVRSGPIAAVANPSHAPYGTARCSANSVL